MPSWLEKYLTLHSAEGPQDARWRLIQGITLGSIFLLLGIGWLMFSLSNALSQRRDLSSTLINIIANVNRYEKLLVDMETSQRGYLLTHNRDYLEPFKSALAALPELSALIEIDLARYPASRQLFAGIKLSAKTKIEELQRTRDLDTFNGPDAALAFVQTDQGKTLMDALRKDLDRLRGQTAELLASNRGEVESLSAKRSVTMATLLLLALLGSGLSLWLMRRYAGAEYMASLQSQRAEAADAASLEKSSFLANMSHEIRTPMNAIFGFSQLLAEMVQDPREQFYAKAITQSGQVLLGLIDDILDMSKIEAGKLTLSPEPTDLRALLRGCEVLFLHMVTEKGLRLSVIAETSLPSAVVVDPLRLRQILINLIGNALKYTPAGSISVAATASPSAEHIGCIDLDIAVSDTGPGIPAEKLNSIFEPFTQLKEGGIASGAGLGLSIVKRLAAMMGGTVQVASALGAGSQFTVHLPGLRVSSDPLTDRQETVELATLPGLKILVVDDVELNRRLLDGLFAASQHRVLLASGGAEGVAMAGAEIPDVVFMDIRMPGMDGLAALKAIRSNPDLKHCKVVAATASSLLGEEPRMRHLFDGYLRKPLTRGAVAETLHRLFAAPAAALVPAPVPLARDAPAAPAALASEEMAVYQAAAPALHAALAEAQATLSSDAVRALLTSLEALGPALGFHALRAEQEALGMAAAVFDVEGLELHLPRIGGLLNAFDSQLAASLVEQNP